MNARDAREVHDPAAIHPHESRRIQPAFQFREALVQQVPPRATVQLNIIVGGFDPVDGIDRNEVEPVSISDHNALRPLARARIEQCLQLRRKIQLTVLCDALTGALDASAQPHIIEGLQKIIHCVQLESFHRVLIKSVTKMTVGMRSGPTRSTTSRPVQSCNCTFSSEIKGEPRGAFHVSYRIDYGNSSVDVRQRAVATLFYDLRFGKNAAGFRRVALSGWQANLAAAWSTGLPFTVLNVTDISNTSRRKRSRSPQPTGLSAARSSNAGKVFQRRCLRPAGATHARQRAQQSALRPAISPFRCIAVQEHSSGGGRKLSSFAPRSSM